MSWSKQVTLWCDGDGCPKWAGDGSHTVEEAENNYCRNGEWTKLGANKHLCPSCTEERDS